MDQIKEYGPMVSGALGTVLSAKGSVDSGNNMDRAMRFRARQLEQNAGQEIAASTVAAQEEQRKSALIASRAIAVAAASGGGGSVDPTVLRILQGINAEGDLASATQLYNGQETARGLRTEANAARYEGKLYKSAGRKKALGTVLSAASEMAATWGSPTDKPKGVFDEGNGYRDDGRVTA